MAEQLSPAVVEDHAMDGCPETQDSGLEQTKDNYPEHQDEVYISCSSFYLICCSCLFKILVMSCIHDIN
jgi:hypothetical protein